MTDNNMTISVIIPVYNCAPYICSCLDSILNQSILLEDPAHSSSDPRRVNVEVSIYDDGSTDGSYDIILQHFVKSSSPKAKTVTWITQRNSSEFPGGVGFARNRAIEKSSGQFLCFLDADDIMEPTRLSVQLKLALVHSNAIIGSRFKRLPENSTRLFTKWANEITDEQLVSQIFTTFGPTIVMPTWFMKRTTFQQVPGGFDQSGKGTPEDLIFFYQHLDKGGKIVRAPQYLMYYRYHPSATSFSVKTETIRKLRLMRLEKTVIRNLEKFSIWNAGKAGRRLFNDLGEDSKKKVQAFCDVDTKKLHQGFYEPHPNPSNYKIPILFPAAFLSPLIICVKLEVSFNEDFQQQLNAMNLTEGTDYFFFN